MRLNDFKKTLPLLAQAEIVPLIIGESGVGKTESVKQVADDLGYRFINIRLGQLADAGDLTGLPDFIEVDGVKVTSFMQPDFFPKTGEKCVVFFDEINRCHPDLIQAVFQAIERNGGIGQYKFDFTVDSETNLPNTIRVAASNPPTDEYVVHDITDKAFLNRFCHIKFEPNTQEALDYFSKIGVDASITAFLSDQPTMLEVEGERYDLSYVKPTRRTWEAAHRFMKLNVEDSIRREVMMGLVGSAATTAYESFMQNWDIVVKADDVLDRYDEIEDRIPVDRVDVLANTNAGIIERIKNLQFNDVNFNNFEKYLVKIPKDVAVGLLERLIMEKDENDTLLCTKEELKHLFDGDGLDGLIKENFFGSLNQDTEKSTKEETKDAK